MYLKTNFETIILENSYKANFLSSQVVKEKFTRKHYALNDNKYVSKRNLQFDIVSMTQSQTK